MNGPSPLSVSTRPAALTAVTSVLRSLVSPASCTMLQGTNEHGYAAADATASANTKERSEYVIAGFHMELQASSQQSRILRVRQCMF